MNKTERLYISMPVLLAQSFLFTFSTESSKRIVRHLARFLCHPHPWTTASLNLFRHPSSFCIEALLCHNRDLVLTLHPVSRIQDQRHPVARHGHCTSAPGSRELLILQTGRPVQEPAMFHENVLCFDIICLPIDSP